MSGTMTTEAFRQAPVLDIDPYDEAVLESPFETFAEMRRAGPVAFLPKYDMYVMARHRDVQPALKDWQTFSSTGGSGVADIRKPGAWRPPSAIVEVDPPRHSYVRSAMQKAMSPQLIRSWREVFVKEAEKLVDTVLQQEYVDGVVDISETYISTTFPPALGLPVTPETRENLFLLGSLNFDAQGPRNARYEATQKQADKIMPWHDAMMRRENLLPGGFGDRLYQAVDAGELEPELAPLLVRSFLRGGLDTTSSAISGALWYLAQNPDQYALLRQEPERVRPALEEAMRLETPIQTVGRLTMRDVVVDGTLIPNDRKVMMFLGAANRDPDFWDRPDDYDLTRSTLGHVALGNGIHMCIGQMIARLEGECILSEIIKCVSEIRLEGPPVRRINNVLRSLKSLPLRLKAA
ncbi:cytochrome P450 [Bordetella sp. 02P26C-1]|uniref:cytochrome P450 n=1 Tax=Bordetella sp. 02P26C-1 TaxID=2683195 RepID=UPI0013532AB1|nr:cytochrome P450 [Bordetella sp. 02P26C-1]MVW78220.1 cytochrome P450 [Bordetella sp. 02P26C-1]